MTTGILAQGWCHVKGWANPILATGHFPMMLINGTQVKGRPVIIMCALCILHETTHTWLLTSD